MSLIRANPRFKLRSTVMAAAVGESGSGSSLARAQLEERGHVLSFHSVQQSVLFSSLQVSTSFISLIILGYVGTVIGTALFCKFFWTQVIRRVLP